MKQQSGPATGLSTKTRLYIVLGVGFPCLAWMKYFDAQPSTGKWGGVERLLLDQIGKTGFTLILIGIGVLFLALAVFGVVNDRKGRNK